MASSGQVGIGIFVAALMVPGLVGCTEVVTVTETVTQTVTVTTTPRPQTPTSPGGATPSEEHTQSPIPTPGETPTCVPYGTPDPNEIPTPTAPNEAELKLWLNEELIYTTQALSYAFSHESDPDVSPRLNVVLYDPANNPAHSIAEVQFESYDIYLCTHPTIMRCVTGGGGDFSVESVSVIAFGSELPEGVLPDPWAHETGWRNCEGLYEGNDDEVSMELEILETWPRFRASASIEVIGVGERHGDRLVYEAFFDHMANVPR